MNYASISRPKIEIPNLKTKFKKLLSIFLNNIYNDPKLKVAYIGNFIASFIIISSSSESVSYLLLSLITIVSKLANPTQAVELSKS